MKKHNEILDEKNLLKELAAHSKNWGLDFYEESTKTDLVKALKNNHLQALEIVDYLEDHVVPFLDEYDCSEEKRALKKWVVQMRGTIEKGRRSHQPKGKDNDYLFRDWDDI
jgi:hypothetical protein